MKKFGELIRQKREEKTLLLRHVAAQLDIDTAMLSKVERGERNAKREHVLMLSEILDIDVKELLTMWFAERIYDIIKDEDNPDAILKVAEQSVTYLKNKK